MQAAPFRPLSYFAFLLVLGCCACNTNAPHEEKEVKAAPTMPAIDKIDGADRYMGTYSGDFGDGIITLVLNYISGKTVSGYDLHKGLRRNVNGEVTWVGDKLKFLLRESGDHPFNGTFSLFLDTARMEINGEKLSLTRQQWDLHAPDREWGRSDTTIDFKSSGICEYGYYQDRDAAASRVLVRGNYDKKGDTFRIEWEKTPYIAESMRMIESKVRESNTPGDTVEKCYLRGGGMQFTIRSELTN